MKRFYRFILNLITPTHNLCSMGGIHVLKWYNNYSNTYARSYCSKCGEYDYIKHRHYGIIDHH
jgi:hypothetical protein